MAEYVYEFLYRGRPSGAPEPTAWHVIIANPETNRTRILNMTQAEAEGWNLAAIVTGLNTEVMIECESLRTELAAAEAAAADQ